jgi:hypothetical protein
VDASVVILILIVAGLVATFFFFRAQTKAKGRWGLGAFGASCPRCGRKLPMIRKPTSREEMLWGGWTCPSCGCKVDKYGRERSASS